MERFLAAHPAINHERRGTENRSTFTIPPRSADGFEVFAEATAASVVVGATAGGFHDELEDHGAPMTVDEFAQFVIDCLTPYLDGTVRIREFRSNGRPYAWQIEEQVQDRWVPGESTAHLFKGWFGKKTEHLLANEWLPKHGRLTSA